MLLGMVCSGLMFVILVCISECDVLMFVILLLSSFVSFLVLLGVIFGLIGVLIFML